MAQLPKIVHERLKVSTSASDHPDPDLLTAFAERALPASERAVVMGHLARCGDCRDIVALALPDMETVEIVDQASPARTGWLRWPVLRWGVVAAGIGIASLGVLQYRQLQRTMTVDSKEVARNNVADAIAQPPSAQPAQIVSPAEKRDEIPAVARSRSDFNEMKRVPAVTADSAQSRLDRDLGGEKIIGAIGGVAGSARAGVRYDSGSGQNPTPTKDSPSTDFVFSPRRNEAAPATAAKQAPSPELSKQAIPQASQTVEVQAEAANVQASTQNQTDDQLAQNLNELPLQGRESTDSETVAKAKPPVPGQAAGSAAPTPPNGAFQTQPTLLRNYRPPIPRWTISSNGGLQRSIDGGNTWQDVNVYANSGSAASSMQVEVVAKNARERQKENKALKQAISVPVFRVVTATGPQVWAGGSGGTLYHSMDGGERWTRVVPSASGVLLTGDITSLEFSDQQRGKITTSTSEVWTTADGGQSWQKQ